jgi:HEAT repeats
VAALNDGSDKVAIRFKTFQDRVLTGRLDDPDIQRALSIVLLHSPGDHIRLRTIGLLEKIKPDRMEVQQALIHTLENDGNPGVRLKAIRLLINAFPINETIKNVLVSAFFSDTNEGIRIEAAHSLSSLSDPDILPLLKQKADANEYVRSLLVQKQ